MKFEMDVAPSSANDNKIVVHAITSTIRDRKLNLSTTISAYRQTKAVNKFELIESCEKWMNTSFDPEYQNKDSTEQYTILEDLMEKICDGYARLMNFTSASQLRKDISDYLALDVSRL